MFAVRKNTHRYYNMRTIQFREAICEAMSEEMRRDESIYLMGEEVAEYNGAYKASKGMLAEFGEKRVIDTPIAELGFTGIAVGSAMNGCRPIVEYMTFNFCMVGIDQIINNAAKMRQMSGGQFNIPIVFRGPTASAGQLGATHSQAIENWFANTPGLKVVVPSNVYDAKGLLKSAIRDNDPVIFMESEQMYGDKGEVPDGEYTIPLGVADVVREGTDVTIVSFGKIIKEAFKAADDLAKEGISCEVIDLRTVRPMDTEAILKSVKKTNRLVILEEAWPFASVSSEITYLVQEQAFDFLDAPIQRITTADTPAPYSPVLLKEWLPNADDVIKAVKKVLYKK
nr:pyruvate dehydrogenase complex E1 component subunit beta [uncultured Flavobacterium sp.]